MNVFLLNVQIRFRMTPGIPHFSILFRLRDRIPQLYVGLLEPSADGQVANPP